MILDHHMERELGPKHPIATQGNGTGELHLLPLVHILGHLMETSY
jgi:hypothetical protein